MKVLFAVNNEGISEAIIKKYQSMYKEIISYKNVYYFNAITKELQKDKSYDRIVISEDLEPFSNNNYEVIDKFIFDKLDSISDEASNTSEGSIPIILITTDRRNKGENLLIRLFGIGIYSILLGKDRSIDNVCRLINKPRTKKEAKEYYQIDAEDVTYSNEDIESVPEVEIQNILTHYKKLGKNEERYVESFDNIAQQYTDAQLKVIARFLPLNVRAVLEEKSPKYQKLMLDSVKGKLEGNKKKEKNRFMPKSIDNNSEKSKSNRIDLVNQELQKNKLTKPVVIPATVKTENVKKVFNDTPKNIMAQTYTEPSRPEEIMMPGIPEINNVGQINFMENMPESKKENIEEQPVKRGRGRPPKVKSPEELVEQPVKRGRGRPRKVEENREAGEAVNLFDLSQDVPQNIQKNNIFPDIEDDDENILPGIEETKETNLIQESKQEKYEDVQPLSVTRNFQNNTDELSGMRSAANNAYVQSFNSNPFGNNYQRNEQNTNEATQVQRPNSTVDNNPFASTVRNNLGVSNNTFVNNPYEQRNTELTRTNNSQYSQDINVSNLITGDKKIISFVGTSKNGTSFIVNNLATMLSEKGINTAILDLTKNQNSYYIYTKNDDELRNKAFNCVEQLRSGVANGIRINESLTVYTSLPGNDEPLQDVSNILETLVRNHTLVILDCDFETNYNYFANSQEIYLVQTFDILTIQPLTAFLNDLQYKGILDQNKLRIIINKTLKLRKLTPQMIIGGISCYNDPASTYMNTLFDKDKIRFLTIPFEDQTYAKYLERLVDCDISLKGYSKGFMDSLTKLGNMVYPLISAKQGYGTNQSYNDYARKNGQFSMNMNDTLNKMRKKF